MASPIFRRVQAVGQPLAIAVVTPTVFVVSAFAQEKTLEPVVVTASRTQQIAKEVLADHITITSEEIVKSGHTSLVDLLQRQRGIEITRNGGPGTQSAVFMRGTDSRQNIVLVDGVRVGSSTSGGASWNAIPLSQIERVEIVYGPLSTMYGADAVGGVVQIFTKQGDGPTALSASAGAGSFGARSLDAGVSGESGGFRYAIRAAHERSDDFSATKKGASGFNPDKDGHDSTSASGQFGLRLAKGHEVGVNFLHNKLESQYDQSARFDDRTRQKLATYGVYLKNQISSRWNSHLQVAQSQDEGAFTTAPSAFSATGLSHFNTTQKHISWLNNISIDRDLLQVMAEQRKEDVESSNAALNGTRTTDSVAAAYQLRRGRHLAAVSIRNDDNSQFGSHRTGNASYGYRLTNAWRANIGIGTSFRAPNFNELYFPGYGIPSNKPEKGRSAEIGLYYEDGKVQYSAVYYRNRLADLIINTPTCPIEQATHPFGCAYNVNKALLSGLSLGASTVLDKFTIRGSLDLQDPKDETTGRQLVRRAKMHGTLGVDYSAGALSSGGEVVFSGRRFDDANNRVILGGYGIVNFYANYDFAENWTLFGRWNNVLDKKYEQVRYYNTAESNLFVGVRYAMK